MVESFRFPLYGGDSSITLSRCSAGPPRAAQWNPYAWGQHAVAFVHLVFDLRRIRVETLYMDQIETPARRGIVGGVGPGRYAVGAHAPGESQHGAQGRLVLGTADPELQRVNLRQPARQLIAAVGIGKLRHPV